jgi:ketosteroid isomerase-like protein
VSDPRHDVIRRQFERWNRGDRELPPEEIDPEAEVHSAMTGFTYRGYDGVRKWMAEIDDQFDSWRVSVEEMENLPGDHVLVLGAVEFRGRESQLEFEQPIGWVYAFKAGRVLEMNAFGDHEKAREAARAVQA